MGRQHIHAEMPVKMKQFLVVINTVVKMKQFLVVLFFLGLWPLEGTKTVPEVVFGHTDSIGSF